MLDFKVKMFFNILKSYYCWSVGVEEYDIGQMDSKSNLVCICQIIKINMVKIGKLYKIEKNSCQFWKICELEKFRYNK